MFRHGGPSRGDCFPSGVPILSTAALRSSGEPVRSDISQACWATSTTMARSRGPITCLKKLGDGFAMAPDESGLAAADVGDQGDGERQVRFLPEIGDFARLAVVAKIEILALEASHGYADER